MAGNRQLMMTDAIAHFTPRLRFETDAQDGARTPALLRPVGR
ncbi:MAG: hypothetical protein ACRDKL_12405 [Solirubrobacteraceae bacterium]